MTWYIAVVNPNCHRRVESGLAALGYRALWPKTRKWVSHARRKVAKEYPVLGRYLFVEVPDRNFYSIGNVNGVEALVRGCDGEPAKIPAEVVWGFHDRYAAGEWDFVANETGEFEGDEIEQFVDENGEIKERRKLVTRKNRIPAGALIRVMEGEFADLMAVIRGRKNGKLEFLARGKWAYTHEANVRAA